MTVTQALVLSLVIALWATGNGVSLANNTTIMIIMLIALIAISYSTTRRTNCQSPWLNAQNGGLFNTNNLFT